MKSQIKVFLVSHVDGHFNVYDYFVPTKVFRFKKDAEDFIKKQKDPSTWQIDTVPFQF